MSKKSPPPFFKYALAIAGVCFLLFMGLAQAPLASATTYTGHAPIHINGDNEFIAANGVTTGDGTTGTPYVIQLWSINCATDNGITIRNTTKAFRIQLINFENGAGDGTNRRTGIHLENVYIPGGYGNTPTVFTDYIATDNSLYVGIWIKNSSYVTITGSQALTGMIWRDPLNTIHTSVWLESSNACSITYNNFYLSGSGADGIDLEGSYNNFIEHNRVKTANNDASCITIERWGNFGDTDGQGLPYDSQGNIIQYNEIGGIGTGVYFYHNNQDDNYTITNIFANNLIENCNNASQPAVFIRSEREVIWNNVFNHNAIAIKIVGAATWNAKGTTVKYNTIENNSSYGIYIEGSAAYGGEALVYGNTFDNNTDNARSDTNNNTWYLASSGNYWDDWQSPDADSDGRVDVARPIQGGTDFDPYPLVYGSVTTPTVSITPTSGPIGTPITITGDGFTPNTIAIIKCAFPVVGFRLVTVDATGHFSTEHFVNAGEDNIYGIDPVTGRHSNTVYFTITATPPTENYRYLQITPSAGPTGTVVTFTGTGFTANSTVYINTGYAFQPYLTTTSDNYGGISTTWTIPGGWGEAIHETIWAIDINSQISNRVSFTVTYDSGPSAPTENIDIVALFLPLTGGNRTTAGFAAGLILLVMPLSILGLAMVAGGKVQQDSGYVIIVFAFAGMALATLTSLWPWWILVAIFAVVALLLARKWT